MTSSLKTTEQNSVPHRGTSQPLPAYSKIGSPLVDALRTVLVVPTSDLRAMLDRVGPITLTSRLAPKVIFGGSWQSN